MATTKIRVAYRLSSETLSRIAAIAERGGGLTATRVIENAVSLYHLRQCGPPAPTPRRPRPAAK